MEVKIDKNNKLKFAPALLKWHLSENKRQMPWKGEKDPYKIWLSEIILQQTRVEQGLNYYKNFINTFPDINQLAGADDGRVFKLWEGLGYYSRCKNLLLTARYIVKERSGKFPETYDEMLQLKGIGTYTAAAISSFAFNLPYAVVDGNVFRVIARVFGISKPIDTAEGKRFFTELADELLDKKKPGIYNQALMDFGAVICKPVSPLCQECIFRKKCYAYQHNKINELPVKLKIITVKKRVFNYLVLDYKNEILVHERLGKDIWQHLYEFCLFETKKLLKPEEVTNLALEKKILKAGKYVVITKLTPLKQLLSHQLITGQFIYIHLTTKPVLKENYILVRREQLKNYPFPKLINNAIKEIFVEKK
ncbi:MAG: A/G-specific adenine glycosylase [Bacteroidetes bacterium]|nr:A/G-specific adenine glycosylase [Bacteroidota bacterium]